MYFNKWFIYFILLSKKIKSFTLIDNDLKKLKIGLIMIDLKEIFPMKQSEFEIPFSVKSYDNKNFWKLRKLQGCQKAPNFQTIKDINLKL